MKYVIMICAAVMLSGCVTFSFQKDSSGDYAWQSLNWQMGNDVVPLVKFDIDK